MRYQKPSIVEALCEFQFAEESDWDPTAFGLFFGEVKEDLPHREPREAIAAELANTTDGLRHQISRQPRMLFLSADRKQIVQLGEKLLVVNAIEPYPGWEVLRKRVLCAGEAYAKAVSRAAVVRSTVRYIDRVGFEPHGFKLGKWISCDGNYFPRKLADCDQQAAYKLALPVGDAEHFMLSMVLGPADDGSLSLTLDTEMFCERRFASVEATVSLLDRFHEQIVDAFENCITDEMRQLLVPQE